MCNSNVNFPHSQVLRVVTLVSAEVGRGDRDESEKKWGVEDQTLKRQQSDKHKVSAKRDESKHLS